MANAMRRRRVYLRSLPDLIAEVDRVHAAAVEGRVRPLGNWTTAQTFQHLATFVQCSLDGFAFKYPWPMRWLSWLIGRLSWRLLLRLAFRPGFTNPPIAATLEPDAAVPLDVAYADFRQQIGRLVDGERMTERSPTGEKPSHEQWVECHLRHAELHLSFLQLDSGMLAEKSACEGA